MSPLITLTLRITLLIASKSKFSILSFISSTSDVNVSILSFILSISAVIDGIVSSVSSVILSPS